MASGNLIPVFRWVKYTSKYMVEYRYKMGRWVVGSYYADGLVSRNDSKKVSAKCCLPGLKEDQGHFETMESAKAKVESVTHYWLAKTNETEEGE